MGLPWLDQPVMLHSSRENTCTLTPEQCAYRNRHWVYWYQSDHVYGHATVYFMCVTIGVFIIKNVLSRHVPSSISTTSVWRRIQAVLRFLAYRCFRIRILGIWAPTLGVILLGLAGFIYFMSLTLGPKPYYWPNIKHPSVNFGNSPPIATRSGFMALALMPFLFIFAAKANYVSVLTGISYEKLQVFHQWTAWAMFVLALVHTFPFIVYNIWKGDMVEEYKSNGTYWTGIACLIPQAWLTLMSIGPIRNTFYELFKATHYLATIFFVVFFFIHCDFRLTSWDYFIATGALYLSCLLFSQLRTYIRYGFAHRATLTLLPSGVIEVRVPANFGWKPGQHMFVRSLTLGLHSLSTHPFTICSLPSRTKDETSSLAFYITPTSSGFTARLASLAQSQPQATVPLLLDGPYSGIGAGSLAKFDKALILAGGSGAGFTLPVIEDILLNQSLRADGRKTSIHVVLATRSSETLTWFSRSVEALCSPSVGAGGAVTVAIHVTGEAAVRCSMDEEKGLPADDKQSLAAGKGAMEKTNKDVTMVSRIGRPDISAVVSEETMEPEVSVGIAVCGPKSMLYDVRNAAAAAEMRILRGKGAKEVYLHSEHFGW